MVHADAAHATGQLHDRSKRKCVVVSRRHSRIWRRVWEVDGPKLLLAVRRPSVPHHVSIRGVDHAHSCARSGADQRRCRPRRMLVVKNMAETNVRSVLCRDARRMWWGRPDG
jgi:hypothetical protein